METSEFTLRLLLLFFPGVVCAYLIDTLTIHRSRSQFEFILNSLVLGIASYFLYWAAVTVIRFFGYSVGPVLFWHTLTDTKSLVSFREVSAVTAISIFLGLGITGISTYKLHFRIAHALRLTKKFGDLDVWGFVFNSPQVEWATVRDSKRNLAYDGWVQLFSDDSQSAELLLRDVKVYTNDTGEHLYDVESMYLSFEPGNIMIEFRSSTTESEAPNCSEEDPRGNGKEGGTESQAN
jgi:hypothetical protein